MYFRHTGQMALQLPLFQSGRAYYAHHCTLKDLSLNTLGCCNHKCRKIFVLICVINITMSVFQKVLEADVVISVDEIHQSLET